MAFTVLDTFQSFKRIMCVCPCCKELHRLSDLSLSYRGKAPRTWLDDYECKVDTLEKKEEKFDEKESKIREEAAERGRKRVPAMIRKSMEPCLAQLKLNPYDIKLITHPVDFVVFEGLNDDALSSITFLSKKTPNLQLAALRKEVKKAVEGKAYDWKTMRVDSDGGITYE